MNNLEKKFNEFSGNVRLTDAEKNAMREYLLEYQALRPVRIDATARQERQATISPLAFFSFKKPMPVLAALMLFLAGSVGVSAAAENALPGDALYPVKVSVNERVGAAFALSDEAKASYDTALADTRLAEAETLAEEGRLSTTTEANLAASFSANADSAEGHIAKLESDAPDAAAVSRTKLDAVFAAHAAILADVSANASEKSNLISAVSAASHHDIAMEGSGKAGASAKAVPMMAPAARTFSAMTTSSASESASATATAHAGVSATAAAAMKQAAVDSYDKAKMTLNRYSGKLSAEANASAKASLSAAQDLIAEGDAALAAGGDSAATDAFAAYKNALSAEEELMLRVRASASGTVSVSVTPSILTELGIRTDTHASDDTSGVKATVRGILDIVDGGEGSSTASGANASAGGSASVSHSSTDEGAGNSDDGSSGTGAGVSGQGSINVGGGSVNVNGEGGIHF
jgi:hypothetical protein